MTGSAFTLVPRVAGVSAPDAVLAASGDSSAVTGWVAGALSVLPAPVLEASAVGAVVVASGVDVAFVSTTSTAEACVSVVGEGVACAALGDDHDIHHSTLATRKSVLAPAITHVMRPGVEGVRLPDGAEPVNGMAESFPVELVGCRATMRGDGQDPTSRAPKIEAGVDRTTRCGWG